MHLYHYNADLYTKTSPICGIFRLIDYFIFFLYNTLMHDQKLIVRNCSESEFYMFSRFYHVIFRNLHHIYMIPQMEYVSRHPEKYSEEQMYALDRLCIRRMIKPGRITTEGYGIHNLPDEGGYIMCPNHQGKYDALGIMLTHDKPCSVVMDIEKSNPPRKAVHQPGTRQTDGQNRRETIHKDHPRDG